MKKLHLFILSCCLTFCAIPVFSQNRELEPNDGFSTANSLSFDTELKGTSISRNVDFFKITVSKPMVLTITVNGVTLGQSIEAELYDPTLKFIDSKFTSNGTILLNQLVCSVGVYYIKLHSVAGSSDYTLKVKSDASDVYECNNTFNDATGIPFDKAIKASINSAGDVDFYKVNMLKPAVLNIAVENVPSDQKMYVFLYDSKQEYIGKETASDNGKNVYFSQLGCGGTYYIKVYSINNIANNAQYTLKVNADASDIYECNNSFNEAKQISLNSELKASINTADDVDFYKITITKPTDINVSVEGVDASQSMSIEMYDDKQIKLGRAFGNKGMNIFYNQLVCSSGTYYIKLFSLGGPSASQYTMKVKADPLQPTITTSNSIICIGSSTTLTASACTGGTLSWTGGLTGTSITVSPTATKSYKVLCTRGGCKSDSSIATSVTVLPKPIAATISSNINCAIPVTKQWDKTLKGNGSENVRVMLALADGGYILGGENQSTLTNSLDYWLVKIDANGNKVWEKTFGGTKDENLASMVATNDGGYVLFGYSNSDISGDKSEAPRGLNDYWVIKVNANGTKVWDKTFGGIAHDIPKSIVAASDGGFLLGGQSLSGLNGDKSEASKGTYDYWVVKINANGAKLWDKSFGGDGEENFSSMVLTNDGGFVLGGYSSSGISGNKSETARGASDYWVVKINSTGTKVWDKTFGGSSVDILSSIVYTADGGFLLGGGTLSTLSGDKSESSRGDFDYWVVKLNPNGIKLWDKTFGGNNLDYFRSMVSTNDGGFLLAGDSFSGVGNEKSEASKGNMDYWIVKVNASGVKVWDKSFGGNNNDFLTNIVLTNDGGFLVSGSSLSGLSGDKTDVGTQSQYCWLVKALVCTPNNISSSEKPTLTATGCTGTVTWSNGVAGNSITVSPSTTTIYTATCTVNSCLSATSNAITVTVPVKPKTPTITASNTSICGGTNATLTASACDGGTLSWTGGLIGNIITVSPIATKAYKVVCSQQGVSSDSSAATKITVIPKPTQPKITASNTSICVGSSAVLTASACTGGTLSWTGGLTGSSITISPTATKSYKVLCTQGGCKSDSSVATTIAVMAKPIQPKITASNTSICAGSSSALTASACTGGTLSWTGGLTGSSITVSPTASKSYKVLCTQGGCKSDSSVATTIAVIAKPTQPKITASNTSICSGSSSVLTASACTGGTLSWTGGLTGSSITISPTATKSYKVLCTQGGCKSDSSLAITITVMAKPTQPKITASNTSICVGTSTVLTASACTGGTLSWTGGLTGSSITVSPRVSKSYKVLCTIGGCKSDSSVATTIAVIAKPTQPKITASNTSICVGSSAVLTASACTGGTLSWTGGLTGTSITVSPTVTKSYKVLCTQSGCKSDSSVATTITVIAKPTQPKITASNTSICVGSSTVLTASACTGGTLTWTGGLTGSSITVSPTASKSYKVLCTQSGCKSDSSVATTITVMAKPIQPKITASNTSICVGTSTVLTASACTGGTLSWTGGLTGSSITVSPTASKSYKVLCTQGGCKSDSSVATTIAVMAKPAQPKITASNTSICAGSSSVLTASACTGGTLTWTGGLTGSSITVSPTVTKSYKVLCTQSGCKSDSSLATTIAVMAKPTQPKITASNTSICVGSSTVLTASACTSGTLTWTGGLTGSSITVSPTVTKSYKVLCTQSGCKSDSSLATTIAVLAKPTQPKITASNTSICVGGSTVLTASACTGGTLSWTGGLTGSSITVSPTVTKSYKVLCTQSGCKSDSSVATTITVIAKPSQPKITASNTSICVGSSTVLTASACTGGTLSWTGSLTGTSITVSPTVIKSYKVLCTIGGCKSDSSIATTIAVMAKPTQPKITASNTSICVGSSAVLTASACTGGTLTWTGSLTGSSITVSPTVTKSYKVLCTQSGCKSDSSVATTITVIAKPTQPKITASNTSICVGTSTVLTASACTGGTLSWTGGLTGSSITVLPTVTKSYKVLCTQSGCNSDSSVATTIVVMAKPSQPKITASNTSICVGSSSVLTASACTGGTLSWTGGLTGTSITVSPTVSKSYKVLCTQGGCKSDSSVATTIAVMAKPTQPKITASNTSICVGTSTVLTASVCTGGTLSWTGGLTGSSITVSPTVTKSYKVLCTQSGCKSDSSVATTITVITKPSQPKITASNTSICLGSSAVLTASACTGGTLSWTGGLTGSSITVSPTVIKSYKVLCTIGGCKSDSSVATTIAVMAKPTQPKITASNTSICSGSSSVLTASACTGGTLTWTGGLTGSSITVSPTVIKSYKVLCTIGGCKSDSSVATTIAVMAKPTQPKITAGNTSICVGSSAVLTASACTGGTLSWTGGLTGSSITVSPTVIKSYKVICTQSGCKSDSSVATTIAVMAKPTQPKITASNTSICVGSSAVLTASACTGGTLSWTGGLTGSSITVSPTVVKSYKVLCTQGGCKSDSSLATTIAVIAKPSQPKITVSNTSICAGSSSVLTASACTGGTLIWTGGLTGSSITVSPTKTIAYKVLCTIGGCKSDSSLATTVTVLPKPNAPTITSQSTTVNSVVKQWEKTFGGDWYDYLSCIVPTQDGGYLLGGNSSSTTISGDKSEDIAGGWIVKINADGKKIWDKAYKGMYDGINSIVTTSDGGFLLGTSYYGNTGKGRDYWIIKIDANGSKVWDKTFEGIVDDYLVKIINTSDGGFLIGGSSLSGPYGYHDYWVVKVDVNGNKQWTKFFGGSNISTNILSDIVQTSDGGYLLVGESNSNIGGEKSENSKGFYYYDFWIVKIDSTGKKMWDKTLGGDNSEESPDVVLTPDGGFLLGGSSRSNISGDKSENGRGVGVYAGMPDFWIIKIDSKGKKIWDKTFGGNLFDELMKIMVTPDGGFLLGGSSFSGISVDKSEETQGHWLIKINANGQKIWDKTFGGIGSEGGHPYDLLPTSDGGYIFGGSSRSSNGPIGYWLVKIKENKTTTTTLTATGCTGTVTWSNGATGNSITVSPSTATTYTATCTVNGCVSIASNSINVSASTNARIASIDENTENTDMDKDSKPMINFRVFPNPAKDKLTIQTDLEGEVTFQLYNDLGQKVLESSFVKQVVLPVGNLNRQAHYYLIQHDNKQFTGKVFLE